MRLVTLKETEHNVRLVTNDAILPIPRKDLRARIEEIRSELFDMKEEFILGFSET